MGSAIDLNEIIAAQHDLEEKLSHLNDESLETKRRLFTEHIQKISAKKAYIFPEFEKDTQWLNTTRPLTVAEDFKGKIVIVDFFTYCCINCMHILPDLKLLENRYPVQSGVLVVGVHSAKFENEKVLENVANAVLRYDIRHPVVNDPVGHLWSSLSISCWPTLLILGPTGQILFVLIGEGHQERLLVYAEECLDYYKSCGLINNHELPIKVLDSELQSTRFHFPGKVSCCPYVVDVIAVADTGNHRIIVLSNNGLVKHIIGGPDPGFTNGDFNKAKFHSPQGIAWRSSHELYVADTENHSIREINLISQTVVTLVGDGKQGIDKEGGNKGIEQRINSPWDVCIGPWNSECNIGMDILLIAMAGLHQIWCYAVEDSSLFDGRILKKGTCVKLVGSGNEENRNNSYPHKASFAQPSGICFANPNSSNAVLIVADSESSTIRMINLKTMAVQGVVGGELNPSNLFSFGDKDGVGINAKLQHPLGVSWDPFEKVVYTADSYNHKIKVIDITKQKCETFAGSGSPGESCGNKLLEAQFNEPGGLCVTSDGHHAVIYVADTNNHCVKVINVQNQTINKLPVLLSEDIAVTNKNAYDVQDGPKPKLRPRPHATISLDPVVVSFGSTLSITVNLELETGLRINEEAPNSWRSYFLKNSEIVDESVEVRPNTSALRIEFVKVLSDTFDSLGVECVLYICDDDNLCHMRILLFKVDLIYSNELTNNEDKITFNYTVECKSLVK